MPATLDMEMRKTPEGKSYLVKRCGRCQIWKRVFPLGPDGRKVRKSNGEPKMMFSRHSQTHTGLQSMCNDCFVQHNKARNETKDGRAKRMYRTAKMHNPERVLLTMEEWVDLFMRLWDEQDGRCPKTGWAFSLTQGAEDTRMNPYAPCFDRIDSNGNYEPDNIQLVCCWYNVAKSDHNEEFMQEACAAVAATAAN